MQTCMTCGFCLACGDVGVGEGCPRCGREENGAKIRRARIDATA